MIVLLTISLGPMFFSSYYSLQKSVGSVEQSEYRNLELLADATSNRIQQLLSDTKGFNTFLTSDPEVVQFISDADARERLRGNVQKKLVNGLLASPSFEILFLLDKNGQGLASTNPEMLGQKYSFREYFTAAMQGRSHISDITVGIHTKLPGVFFSDPVRNENGEIVGVAVIKIKGTTVWSILDEVRTQSDSKTFAFLVNEWGVVIYHPDKTQLYRSLMPLDPAVHKKIIDEKRFLLEKVESLNMPALAAAMVGAKSVSHSSYNMPGKTERMIAGIAPVEGHTWVVGVNESAETFAAPLRALFIDVLLVIALVAIVGTIVALILARTIVKPLQSLRLAASAVNRAEYQNAEVAVTSEDEIGDLMNDFNEMVRAVRERAQLRNVFGKVVSPAVRDRLMSGKLELGGEDRKVAVLFSDIRDFSTLSERMTPQEVVTFLNEYLQKMSDAINEIEGGGEINNYIGDAIVVVFGAPADSNEMEWKAVQTALNMRRHLALLNERRRDFGQVPIETGIGISTGGVVAGQIGSKERMLYTVIGDAVNVAARLEALTKDYPDYPILMNQRTYERIKDRSGVQFKGLGPLKVKGRVEPVEVYAVSSAEGSHG